MCEREIDITAGNDDDMSEHDTLAQISEKTINQSAHYKTAMIFRCDIWQTYNAAL